MISTRLTIKGITEPVILSYFETLNAGDFEATASSFAAEGALCPPFESPIVGREAIANYLKTEAQGLQLYPLKGIAEGLEDGLTEFQIQGKVQTPLFGVNVAWQFIVNAAKEILLVEVKLLASLEELAQLRR
ncbi:MAG: nuclear transport factor 2 family protein [Hydrococcus sp. C42_A2020_068]|uniref:ketosteroid isomerase family protein n=1 Tax=Pleurocapsa sp. PCC 7327 TaxID=118163 RepID=UPI0002E49DEB|nr:ketosteroid isomerase family protein [Pleurocapsa sp. PCC 7327]MBF2020336.1 nuclear transport factor 2 family protein [Hydrococcus sp. C42_A2020_068]